MMSVYWKANKRFIYLSKLTKIIYLKPSMSFKDRVQSFRIFLQNMTVFEKTSREIIAYLAYGNYYIN